MKSNKLAFAIFTAFLSLSQAYAQNDLLAREGGASSVGGGGEIFDLSTYDKKGKLKVENFRTFDQIEYESPFMPSLEVEEYSTHILPNITSIEAKLPETGKYIRGMFEGEGPMWFWVEPKLRETNDAEATTLDLRTLRYKKVQLAVLSIDDLVVQINEKLFRSLPKPEEKKVPGKAFAIMHEGLRAAITRPVFEAKGTEIELRKLTGMLLNPYVVAYSRANLGRMILSTIKESGPLALMVARDLGDENLIEKLTYEVIDIEETLARTTEYQSTAQYLKAFHKSKHSQILPDGSVIVLVMFQAVETRRHLSDDWVLNRITGSDWAEEIKNRPIAVQAFRIKEDRANKINTVEATSLFEGHANFSKKDSRAGYNYPAFRIVFAHKIDKDGKIKVRLEYHGAESGGNGVKILETTQDFTSFTSSDFKEVQKVDARILR